MHWDEKKEEWVDGDDGGYEADGDDDGSVVVRLGAGGGPVRPRPSGPIARREPPPPSVDELEYPEIAVASDDAELDRVDARLAEAGYYRAFLQNPSMFGEVGREDLQIVARVEGAFRRFAKQQIAALFGQGATPIADVFSADEIATLKRLATAFPGALEIEALQRFATHAAGSSKIMSPPKAAPVRVAPIQAPQRGQRPAPAPPPRQAPPPPPERQRPKAKPKAPVKMPRAQAVGGRPPSALPMPQGAALTLALQTQVAEKIEEAQENGAPPGAAVESAITQQLLRQTAQALGGLVKR